MSRPGASYAERAARVTDNGAIDLLHGITAYVDPGDVEKVRQHLWFAHPAPYTTYVITKSIIRLHRFLLDAKKGESVDHKDGNGLNNRRSNLRLCAPHQNSAYHLNGKRKSNTGYRGVRHNRYQNGFRASITCRGVYYNLGSFRTAVEAAWAYDQKAIELLGEFATLNFPLNGRK